MRSLGGMADVDIPQTLRNVSIFGSAVPRTCRCPGDGELWHFGHDDG
jgi:hypothetical protein